MDKSKYPLKESPISFLNSTQFLYTFFGNVQYHCRDHWKEFLELHDLCREFYDIRRIENMKSLGFHPEDIKPSSEPLSAQKVQEGEAIFGEHYKRMCSLVVDRFDACLLHEFDGYARQCLDQNVVDPSTHFFHLRACLQDRDIRILNKALYQRSTKLLQENMGMRKILFKDIESYTSQCDILKQKYKNCLQNAQKDSCAMEEFKYMTCTKLRDCRSEINECSKKFIGVHNGDEDVPKWFCMEYGISKTLGANFNNIDELQNCLLQSEERSRI